MEDNSNKPIVEIIRCGTTEHTVSIGKLSLALSKLQGEVEQPTKDKTAKVLMKSGGTYSYKYCDLASIIKKVQPLLAIHELAILQGVSTGQGFVSVTTTISHSSGEWFRDVVRLPVGDDKPQSYGSAMTYARRYGYCAPLGISADEDEDGNLAQDAAKKEKAVEQKTTAPLPGIKKKAEEMDAFNPQNKEHSTWLLEQCRKFKVESHYSDIEARIVGKNKHDSQVEFLKAVEEYK